MILTLDVTYKQVCDIWFCVRSELEHRKEYVQHLKEHIGDSLAEAHVITRAIEDFKSLEITEQILRDAIEESHLNSVREKLPKLPTESKDD